MKDETVTLETAIDTVLAVGPTFNGVAELCRMAADAERKAMMQLFTDPENQPTQYGTVTVEYMKKEGFPVRAELAYLRSLVRQLFRYLDMQEESDSGRMFHPVEITCCRAMLIPALNDVLDELKRIVKEQQ